MMKLTSFARVAPVTSALVLFLHGTSYAAVTDAEAAQLKSTLTPLGAEKAGNADGSIPAWTGGMVDPSYKNGGKRDDLFKNDKPLFSITAANMSQYAGKLSEGTKAMFAKYPDFRMDVYKSERTAAAPQWLYDNTFKNATGGKLVMDGESPHPAQVIGGVPFPIPKEGAEVMWNHLLAWRGVSYQFDITAWLTTSDGKRVMTVDGLADAQMPYYFNDASADHFDGAYWSIRLINAGPPIRAGEAIAGYQNFFDDKIVTWVYLTGQRRTRKLPNPCCDTPTPATAGVMSFDEISLFGGRLTRFDWTLAGKKEIYVPYNDNQLLAGSIDDVIGPSFLNPDKVRWELHRVWVVDAALKAGQRHVSPKSRYYVDEDSWWGLLAERYDANGQLWKNLYQAPFAAPDIPAVVAQVHGFNDLISGAGFVNGVLNGKASQYKIMPRYPDSTFTPEALTSDGIR